MTPPDEARTLIEAARKTEYVHALLAGKRLTQKGVARLAVLLNAAPDDEQAAAS